MEYSNYRKQPGHQTPIFRINCNAASDLKIFIQCCVGFILFLFFSLLICSSSFLMASSFTKWKIDFPQWKVNSSYRRNIAIAQPTCRKTDRDLFSFFKTILKGLFCWIHFMLNGQKWLHAESQHNGHAQQYNTGVVGEGGFTVVIWGISWIKDCLEMQGTQLDGPEGLF